MSGNAADRVQFGPFEADLHTHELWKYGTRIRLVGQPFEVLAILLANPGELVTRDALRERLWPGDTFVDFNHGLNAAVNKLREALSDSAENPRYAETLPRRGYRFIATVTRAGSAPSSLPPEPVQAQENLAPQDEPSPIPTFAQAEDQDVASSSTPRNRFYLAGLIGLAACLFFVFAVWFVVSRVSTIAGARDQYSAEQRIRPLTP